jgi:hypothetical protein
MIRSIEHQNIDKALWDIAIAKTPDSTVCSSSWFLDIVSPGWCALIEGEYERVFPLTHASKYGIQYLRQPKFCQQLGVSGPGSLKDPSADLFISECMRQYRFCEVNLRTGNTLDLNDVQVTSNRNLVLDLSRDHKTIRKDYSKNHRRNLSKKTYDVSFEETVHPSEVIRLFRDNKGKELRAYNEADYTMLLNLIEETHKRSCSPFIAGVRSGSSGELICGAVFIEYRDTSLFLFSGITREGRDRSAMHFLVDEYIARKAGKMNKLDFEGSNDFNLARFYSGFGAIENVYLHIRYNKLPVPLRWFK